MSGSLVPAKKSLTRQQHVDRIASRAGFTALSGLGLVAAVTVNFFTNLGGIPFIDLPLLDEVTDLAVTGTALATGGGAFATFRAWRAALRRR